MFDITAVLYVLDVAGVGRSLACFRLYQNIVKWDTFFNVCRSACDDPVSYSGGRTCGTAISRPD